MLILGLDTATDVCAVALLDDDEVLVEARLHVPRSHGRRLAPLVAEALAHAGRAASDLGLVAVSAGPGSYTGLRIGMSTAKGLGLSTGAALVAVPTLEALAAGVEAPVAVVLPSRRGEVYAGAYDGPRCLREPAALAVEAVAGWLPEGLEALGGPGAGRLEGVRPDLRRLGLEASGVTVARLGRARLEARGPDDPAPTEPLYLKPVGAVRPRGIFAPSIS